MPVHFKKGLSILIPTIVGIVIGYYLHELRSPSAPLNPHEQTAHHASSSQTTKASNGIEERNSTHPSLTASRTQRNTSGASVTKILSALDRLQDITDPQQKAAQFQKLLIDLLETNPRAALAYVNGLDEGEMKTRGASLIVETLSISDPQFLSQEILSLPNNRSTAELIRGLSRTWAITDVQAALTWAEQLSESEAKHDALLIIRSQWATQDPETASSHISQLPESSSTAALISTIASRWAAKDPSKALEWAKTLPESEKALAISSLTRIWAQKDPTAAGNFAAQLPPGETQNEAVKSIISSWATQNPAHAATWVLQFPAGTLQDEGLRQVVSAWNQIDPAGLQNWAVNLPSGAVRDTALKNFAETIAYWTPEKAADLVGLIHAPQGREQSVETIYRSWSQTDPTSARNWLSGLEVSSELKTRLQSPPATN